MSVKRIFVLYIYSETSNQKDEKNTPAYPE